MAITVQDEFTEAVNTTLASHVPTTAGTGWTLSLQNGTRTQTDFASVDYCVASNTELSSGHAYSAQPNPTTVDQDIQAALPQILTTGDDDPWFLLGRWVDNSNTYGAGTYAASATADKKMWKIVSGVVTELASGDNATAANDVFKLEIRDATKKFYQNDIERLSSTDNAITSAGKWGFGVGNLFVSTNDIVAWGTDNFIGTEVAAGAGLAGHGLLLSHRRNRLVQLAA